MEFLNGIELLPEVVRYQAAIQLVDLEQDYALLFVHIYLVDQRELELVDLVL